MVLQIVEWEWVFEIVMVEVAVLVVDGMDNIEFAIEYIEDVGGKCGSPH